MLANPSFRSRPPILHFSRRRLPLSSGRRHIIYPNKFSFHPLSLLLSKRGNVKPGVVGALAESDLPALTTATSESEQYLRQPYSVKLPFGDRHILVETGHIGRQASGAVTVTDGETVVYCTVCLADVPSEPSDFFPLFVNYQERFSSVGRTSGGFFKREGRAKDHEVLICRLIDRPLRPTMLKGFYHETQILTWVLSYDGLHFPDCLAVTAAGIAVALSEVPTSTSVAGVRVGLVGEKYIVNPTTKEMENSQLDLFLAGTDSAILMIEGYCDFLPEEKLLQAVDVGQDAVRAICNEMDALVKKCGKRKMFDEIKLPPPKLYRLVEEIAGSELVNALEIKNKIPRKKALSSLEANVIYVLTEKGYVDKDGTPSAADTTSYFKDDDEDEDEEVIVDGEVDEGDVHVNPVSRKPTPLLFAEVDVKLVFKETASKFLRRQIVAGGKRSDGRTPSGIRLINSQGGLLPRAHGSALFTRGETQSLAVVTLGNKQMAQRIDNLEGDDELKRFYLQYSFPPSCVGEVGRIGAPSRREIGHGMLAERALEPILPSEEDFPYTIRVESTITESNGSSSMASICGGCLALQDAGVPVKCSIAGIAMGMILDTEEFGGDGPVILSDISGSEDACGDMDFKVAGSEDGVTAFQMDIKAGGITMHVMKQVLLQAKDGRKHILAEMMKCSPPPLKCLSGHAPLIHVMKVKPEKINVIIGFGGKMVKNIIEQSGVEAIETEDDGMVKITAKDLSSMEKSKSMISNLTMVPTVGDIYRNCEIKSIAPYGVFVEIASGREGLCHISELSSDWLAKAEDAFKVGDRVDVKLIEINDKGQLRLSRRALLSDPSPEKLDTKQSTPSSDSPKKFAVVSQDGIAGEKAKHKSSSPTPPKSPKGNETDKNTTVQDKKIRRSSVRKKSSSKVVTGGSIKMGSSLVNGEGKIS